MRMAASARAQWHDAAVPVTLKPREQHSLGVRARLTRGGSHGDQARTQGAAEVTNGRGRRSGNARERGRMVGDAGRGVGPGWSGP